MSQEIYASLFGTHASSELALFAALGRAGRLRRAAFELATDELNEGLWVVEAPEIASMGVPLQRLAADQGDDARYVSATPLEVLGARGWCVRISLEPTADGDTLVTVSRSWVGEGTSGEALPFAVAVLSDVDGSIVRLSLPPESEMVQRCAPLSTAGRITALAWRE